MVDYKKYCDNCKLQGKKIVGTIEIKKNKKCYCTNCGIDIFVEEIINI